MTEADGQMATPATRSMLRDFVASISTMRGDLSNITAPPFVLDTKSTVEIPQYWSENPSVFCAPAKSEDPAERALLVLRWFLSSLRSQNYMGHPEDHGIKKPLNAFLGEVFLAKWEDSMGTTRLVSEQVSHHPPITACRVWNDEHGVEASGYTRQTITFNGAVTIKQTGHALFNLSKLEESYLIPLPELKVRGILSASFYPELNGKYYITSTSGYTSVIDFSGKGWFGTGHKHSLEAKVYKDEDGENNPIYTVKGTWNREFIIHDVRTGEDIETFDVLEQSTKTTPIKIDPIDEQDPWESRRAWKDVISALNRGDMKGTVEAKSKVEQGQREMRKAEKRTNTNFQLRFFKLLSENEDHIAATLSRQIPGNNNSSLATERHDTKGIWTFDHESWNEGKITKPFHDELVPDNSHASTVPISDSNISLNDSETSLPASKRSSLDSNNSIPSLSPSISDSSTRPASPSSIDNNPPPRRSLDTFRLPFRTSRHSSSKDRDSRRSTDLSRPSTYLFPSSASPSSSHHRFARPSSPSLNLSTTPPSMTPISSIPQTQMQTQTKSPLSPRQSVISSTSTRTLTSSFSSPFETVNDIPARERERRSKSLDMSVQEQLDIETMLRDRYSSTNGGSSHHSKRRASTRKSRLSIDSGM